MVPLGPRPLSSTPDGRLSSLHMSPRSDPKMWRSRTERPALSNATQTHRSHPIGHDAVRILVPSGRMWFGREILSGVSPRQSSVILTDGPIYGGSTVVVRSVTANVCRDLASFDRVGHLSCPEKRHTTTETTIKRRVPASQHTRNAPIVAQLGWPLKTTGHPLHPLITQHLQVNKSQLLRPTRMIRRRA